MSRKSGWPKHSLVKKSLKLELVFVNCLIFSIPKGLRELADGLQSKTVEFVARREMCILARRHVQSCLLFISSNNKDTRPSLNKMAAKQLSLDIIKLS